MSLITLTMALLCLCTRAREVARTREENHEPCGYTKGADPYSVCWASCVGAMMTPLSKGGLSFSLLLRHRCCMPDPAGWTWHQIGPRIICRLTPAADAVRAGPQTGFHTLFTPFFIHPALRVNLEPGFPRWTVLSLKSGNGALQWLPQWDSNWATHTHTHHVCWGGDGKHSDDSDVIFNSIPVRDEETDTSLLIFVAYHLLLFCPFCVSFNLLDYS